MNREEAERRWTEEDLRADNKRLTDALTKIRSVVGTSTEAWLIANNALENKP